ncbi:DNA-3-methyladenine glycosylase II [Thalassobacillus pellis]|nr:DNA-3-methyladenine glycosylase [Thalassobacillus pellis]MBM7553712.1 DNA-3-methyladenine glycosylase II [Thalassobacillus pellis]
MWTEYFKGDSFYDFDYVLTRYAHDPLTKIDLQERWIDIPVQLDTSRHVVRVHALGTTASPEFRIDGDTMDEKQEVLDFVFSLFQWDRNLEKIHQHFLETNLEQLFNAHPGTPIVKDFQLYGCLVKTIIHQQLNMKFAYTLGARFIERYGEEVNGVWFHPQPETVAEIPYEDLRELQFSQRKAEYVIDTSRMIAEGQLDLQELSKKNDEEIVDKLVKIRGIGAWTAENWLLFGLGREDLLPKADIGIQNAVKFYLKQKMKPSIQEIADLSQRWEPYRSYASLTLWRSIEG